MGRNIRENEEQLTDVEIRETEPWVTSEEEEPRLKRSSLR